MKYSTAILKAPTGVYIVVGSVPVSCMKDGRQIAYQTEAECAAAIEAAGVKAYQRADCSWVYLPHEVKPYFSTKAEQTSAGIRYTVYNHGEEIGSRTTKKASGYARVMVGRRNFALAESNAREAVRYHKSQIAKYEDILAGKGPGWDYAVRQYGLNSVYQDIEIGNYRKWLAAERNHLKQAEEELTKFSDPNYCFAPKYTEYFVVQFTNARHPAVPAHIAYSELVELPCPEVA